MSITADRINPCLGILGHLMSYLEQSGQLLDLIQCGHRHIETLIQAKQRGRLGHRFHVAPLLDIVMLTEMSGYVGELTCQAPEYIELQLGYIVLAVLQEMAANLVSRLNHEQIYVPLRVTNAPSICKFDTSRHPEGLVLVRGVISSYTTKIKRIRSCVVRCPVRSCNGHELRRVAGGFKPGQRYCFCGTEMKEVPSEREVGDEMVVLILPLDCLAHCSADRVPIRRAIAMLFKDELVQELVLGSQVEVVCYPRSCSYFPRCLLTACSKVSVIFPSAAHAFHPTTGTYLTSPAIAKAIEDVRNSPWSLAVLLASQVGRNILPPNVFQSLRLAILLSLASQSSCHPIPLFICGDEHMTASRLLVSASQLTSLYVTHGTHNAVNGTLKQEDGMGHDDGIYWVEAGSLLLSSHGVCYLGDWESLKKDTRATVMMSVESKHVTLQHRGKLLNFPLKSAVWTHCASLPLKLLRPIIDVFGLPWLAIRSENEDPELCNWFLDISVNGTAAEQKDALEPLIPQSELREFLGIIGKSQPQLSDKASHLIRKYFVASRRARAIGGAGIEECLPLGAIQNLTTLAEAHARLSLRDEVQEADAVAVIALYENSMTTMFGPAFMSPPPLQTNINPDVPLQKQVDSYNIQFQKWLEQYTEALLGEFEE